MRRQRAKGPSVPEVSSYRGRRLRRMVPWLAAAAALLGLVLVLIRPLGMRFSGFLLLGAAALLVMDLLLGQWAAVARARKAVETALPRSSGSGAGSPGDH